ncbi:MAG: uroporphyrinogen-III C-methyltransferase, partial [Myxococcales bacterium]|nr:uroporphyrinogen-III C-methyltransferase [Myxococcales bacterium]
GLVSLVGAGPGDPELLTRRALDRLGRADLILNDALVPDELVALAPQARRFYVGKRAGRHSIDQDGIHRLMIRAARRGDRVVRLKCGDPFVFGRGGEEALALQAAGVPFEIVPGVTSAIAGPALAGIPVTHRGLASGFVVVSGHAESAYAPILGSLAPAAATVVVLMGLTTRGALAGFLIARGWDAATPAAVVLGASHDGAATWTGRLDGLAAAALPPGELPGLLVIGAVAGLATTLAPALAATPVAAVAVP